MTARTKIDMRARMLSMEFGENLVAEPSPSWLRLTLSQPGQASRPNIPSRCSAIRSGPKALTTSAPTQLPRHP
ncbi:hypothetical protein CR513_15203, partial [Mucuna pruriens]